MKISNGFGDSVRRMVYASDHLKILERKRSTDKVSVLDSRIKFARSGNRTPSGSSFTWALSSLVVLPVLGADSLRWCNDSA